MQANKTKILWWVIALLAILNVTTIITIIVHNYSERNADVEESILIEPAVRPINGKYFRHELGFDNNQMEVFRQSNRTFRHKANRIIANINIQKGLMFEGLQTANPDTVKLNTISKEIGVLHTELKDATVQFYMSLSKVCNVQQREKMKEIFTPLFIDLPVRNKGGNGCEYKSQNNKN